MAASLRSSYKVTMWLDRMEQTESSSTEFSRETLKQRLKADGIACETRDLPVGDIMWTAKKVGSSSRREYVLPAVIVRTSHAGLGEIAAKLAHKDLSPMTRLVKHMTCMKLSGISEKVFVLEAPPGQRNGTLTKKALRMLRRDAAASFRTVETNNMESTLEFLQQKHGEVLVNFEKLLNSSTVQQQQDVLGDLLPTFKEVGNKIKSGLPVERRRLRDLQTRCGNSSCKCDKATYEQGQDCKICSLTIQLGDCIERRAFSRYSKETWPIHTNCTTRSRTMLSCISQVAEEYTDSENTTEDSFHSNHNSAVSRTRKHARGRHREVAPADSTACSPQAEEEYGGHHHTEVPKRHSSRTKRRQEYTNKVLMDLTI